VLGRPEGKSDLGFFVASCHAVASRFMKQRFPSRWPILALVGLSALGLGLLWTLLDRSRARRSTGVADGGTERARARSDRIPASTASQVPVADVAASGRRGRAAEIIAQLDAGLDAPTGLGFKVGSDGHLVSQPTRRVGLLDELGRVDPKAAAAYAEKVWREFRSPDEWAVSLRDYARANPTGEGKAVLEEKLRLMLAHEPWRAHASVGYLEAFDVAVFIGGTGLMPLLTELVRDRANPAVSHGAYLALDRMILNEPVPTLTHLLEHPEAMAGREDTRANYFARANVADPAQRELLALYLLAPDRAPSELQTFAGLFPNCNLMVSANLLTRCLTPDGESIRRHDREALQTVVGWQADSRFAALQPQLAMIRQRLAGFVKQGAGD
jgi:hypothetical protein